LPEIAPAPAAEGLLGHVGRIAPEKNHALLEALLDAAPEFRLLLCGEGAARPRLERHPRIEFAAGPGEVLSRSSCFVFPSWTEGLGLAVVEAQAAGLPCIVSNRVPSEAWLIPELLTALDPGAPAEEWAAAARTQSRRERLPGARDRVRAAGYSLDESIARLSKVYAGI
jgi:glycosyltransferase involved in cell wall biosynthesis